MRRVGLEITLLGDVTIRRTGAASGAPSTPRGAQARLAFALLTLERERGVTQDALADALWPEGWPPTWASALRTVVSRVRTFVGGALGDDEAIVARGGTYLLRLPDDTAVDITLAESQIRGAQSALPGRDFRKAQQLAADATERLRAPFLPDSDGDWVSARRARLTELLVVGLEVASMAATALGDSVRALTAAAEAVDRSPLRESAHCCLMAAHAAAGDRAAALRAYQRLRRMLAEELGVDPAAATESAYVSLLGPSPPPSPSGFGDEARSLLLPGATTSLVGREVELAAASHAWGRALAGARQVVFVTGETGVGKTRLAAELARRSTADGARVLFGRCDKEAIVAYQPFVEMLDALVAVTPEDEMPALSPVARAELGAVFPSLAGPGSAAATHDRTVLFDAVTKLVDAAALDHPLLIVLDDLQWADGNSSLLMRHLVRHAEDDRLLIIAVARSGLRPDHPLSEIIQTLDRDSMLSRVRLGGLDRAACTALVQEVLPTAPELPAMVPKLVADTGGNPFMLMELLRAYVSGDSSTWPISEPVSAGLRDLVTGRLAALEPAAHALLAAAAVSGSRFDLDLAAAAAGLDRTGAVEAVGGVLGSGLVVEVGDERGNQYQFAHDLLRRTLYHQLGRTRRRHLHERTADAIEDRGEDRLVRYAAVLAHHRCAGAEPGGDVRAVRWALAAARQASAVGVPTDAERWCRRALGHVARGDVALEAEVLTELGLAQARLDEAGGEATLFDAAVRARRSGRLDLAARAALGLAEQARRRPGLHQDAVALLREVLPDDPRSAGVEASRLPRVLWARLIARQIDLGCSSADGEPTRVTTAGAILRRELDVLDGPDRIDDRVGLAEDLRIVGDALDDVETQFVAHHHRAMVAAIIGDVATTSDALGSMANACRVGGMTGDHWLEEHRVAVATTEGRFAEVRAAATRTEAPHLDPSARDEMSIHQRVLSHWLQGRLGDEAGELLDHFDLTDLLPGEAALLYLARGDRGRAHLGVRELTDGTQPLPRGDLGLHAIGVLSLAAVELNDRPIALDLYGLLEPYATLTCGVGYRSFAGTAALHLGRLAAVAGEWADAERHLAGALGRLNLLHAKPWIALAQHALAQVLEARGGSSDRESVRALRAEARWVAAQLGLRALDAVEPGREGPEAEPGRWR